MRDQEGPGADVADRQGGHLSPVLASQQDRIARLPAVGRNRHARARPAGGDRAGRLRLISGWSTSDHGASQLSGTVAKPGRSDDPIPVGQSGYARRARRAGRPRSRR
jgi:hypothetical protein